MGALAEVLERIEAESGLPRATLMERAGLSYDAWLSWKQGTRRPRRASLKRLADTLRALGEAQSRLADSVDGLREA